MPTFQRLRPWLAVLFAASSLSVHALQVLDARDGVSVAAKVSLKEPTRIKVENASIIDVFGNVWQDKVNPNGDVWVETDSGKGELYVRPIAASATKPINLFVSTTQATYTLLLQPVDMPADTIVLRDRTPRAPRANARNGQAPNHVRALTELLIAMANDTPTSEMQIEDSAIDVRLWQNTRFTLLRRYETPRFVGERYLLTNVGGETINLEPRWFKREGVLAVAVEQATLASDASTNVFILRAEAP
jgi:conjugal transfer pilus assembly protein TraK